MAVDTITESKYYINKVDSKSDVFPGDGSLSIVTQEGTWILFYITIKGKLVVNNCMRLFSTYFLKSEKYEAIDVKKVKHIIDAFQKDYKTISRLSSAI